MDYNSSNMGSLIPMFVRKKQKQIDCETHSLPLLLAGSSPNKTSMQFTTVQKVANAPQTVAMSYPLSPHAHSSAHDDGCDSTGRELLPSTSKCSATDSVVFVFV